MGRRVTGAQIPSKPPNPAPSSAQSGSLGMNKMRGLLLAAALVALASAGGLRRTAVPPPTAQQQASQWREATDPATGRKYYWHIKTRHTTWQRPAELDAPAPTPAPLPAVAPIEPTAKLEPTSAEPVTEPTLVEPAEPLLPLQQKPRAMPLPARAAQIAARSVSRARASVASVVGLGDAPDPDESFVPGKTLLKGLYLSSVFAVAAAIF